MEPLAVNLDAVSVYCDPKSVEDKEETSRVLSKILKMGL